MEAKQAYPYDRKSVRMNSAGSLSVRRKKRHLPLDARTVYVHSAFRSLEIIQKIVVLKSINNQLTDQRQPQHCLFVPVPKVNIAYAGGKVKEKKNG